MNKTIELQMPLIGVVSLGYQPVKILLSPVDFNTLLTAKLEGHSDTGDQDMNNLFGLTYFGLAILPSRKVKTGEIGFEMMNGNMVKCSENETIEAGSEI